MLDTIKDYNWKPYLEIFYGAGTALVMAVVLVLVKNNPFTQPFESFDTLAEWRSLGLLVLAATGRSVWVFLSVVSAKVLAKVVAQLGPVNGEGGQVNFSGGIGLLAFVIVVVFILYLTESAGKTNIFP